VGAELFHAARRTDGRTDMTKLTTALRTFENAPKNTLSSNKPQHRPSTRLHATDSSQTIESYGHQNMISQRSTVSQKFLTKTHTFGICTIIICHKPLMSKLNKTHALHMYNHSNDSDITKEQKTCRQTFVHNCCCFPFMK
jgi:hypothetical protein